LCAIAIALLLTNGCASRTYRFGNPDRSFAIRQSQGFKVTIGGEHPKLDRIERTVHYPVKKLKQWFGKDKSPKPSDDFQRALALRQSQEYLALNQLHDVLIDVREYSPAAQWRRLKENDSISPFWKYTTGTLQHVEYCLMPGRVFHRDHYNVFTNTLSLSSTQPEQSLYTAATAKYLRSKNHPGAFSSACYMPIVPLYRDYYVANDVLSYARFREDWQTEKLLYPQIYGSFGGDLVSQATSLVPGLAYLPFYVKPVLTAGGRIGGSATGNLVLKQREKENASTASVTE